MYVHIQSVVLAQTVGAFSIYRLLRMRKRIVGCQVGIPGQIFVYYSHGLLSRMVLVEQNAEPTLVVNIISNSGTPTHRSDICTTRVFRELLDDGSYVKMIRESRWS